MRKSDQKHYFSADEIANIHSIINEMELCAKIAIDGPHENMCSDTKRQKQFFATKAKEWAAGLRIGCHMMHPDRAKYSRIK